MPEKRYWLGKCKEGYELGIITDGEHKPEGEKVNLPTPCPVHKGEMIWFQRATEDEYRVWEQSD